MTQTGMYCTDAATDRSIVPNRSYFSSCVRDRVIKRSVMTHQSFERHETEARYEKLASGSSFRWQNEYSEYLDCVIGACITRTMPKARVRVALLCDVIALQKALLRERTRQKNATEECDKLHGRIVRAPVPKVDLSCSNTAWGNKTPGIRKRNPMITRLTSRSMYTWSFRFPRRKWTRCIDTLLARAIINWFLFPPEREDNVQIVAEKIIHSIKFCCITLVTIDLYVYCYYYFAAKKYGRCLK